MLTILLGLIPAGILRYVIIKKPVGWGVAFGIGLGILILSLLVLDSSGVSQSQTTNLSGAIGAISIFIVRAGAEKKKNGPES